jgi:hypothetical protein
VNVTGYAYPWDAIDDDACASSAAELGVDVVALAATYHATRVVTPLHPSRRVLDVPHSAAYIPIRPDAWRDQRLKPRAPGWMASRDAFNEAARQFDAQGLPVVAWVVLAHDDDLGVANLEVVARNAFDEPYPYSLCPSNEDVRSYCGTLLEEIMATTSSHGVVLEACGAIGVEHGSVHDKSDMAHLNDAERWLLSICFCRSCRDALGKADLDPSELAILVRRALSGPVLSMESALGEDLALRVARFRAGLSSSLRNELTERVRAVRPEATVTVHASTSPWATGSFPALGDTANVGQLSTVVANCWNETIAEGELSAMKEQVGQKSNLGAYVRADRVADDPALTIERYRRLGVNELHLYHLGLFNRSSLEVARELVAASHRAKSAGTTYDQWHD